MWRNTLNPLPCLEFLPSVWTLPFTSPTPTTSTTKSSSTSRKSSSGLPKLATPKFSTSFWISHVSDQLTQNTSLKQYIICQSYVKTETILNSSFGVAPIGFRGIKILRSRGINMVTGFILTDFWPQLELTLCWSCAAVTNIDTSGIIAFEELEKTLKRRNIQVCPISLILRINWHGEFTQYKWFLIMVPSPKVKMYFAACGGITDTQLTKCWFYQLEQLHVWREA